MGTTPNDLTLTVIPVSKDDHLFTSYYNFWQNDIENYFPDFSPDDVEFSDFLLLVYQNQNVGIFVYHPKGEEMHIDVDFVPPAFRNIGIGPSFFKSMQDDFIKQGFKIIYSATTNSLHRKYLVNDLNFKLSDKHPDLYFLELT